MRGVLLVDKEQGFTSFDVIAVLRGILKTRKIGHGGTLDPNAEGLLPVFVGSAARLTDLLPSEEKEYEAEMILGIGTDTEDIWGTVTEEKTPDCTEADVRAAFSKFTGTYSQLPPMYSAKKVGGKKLYELARKGKEIERTAVPVTVRELKILDMDLPKIRFRARVSKGTYIRSLCRDIGAELGLPAAMSALRRTVHGSFRLSDAHRLPEIREMAEQGRIGEILVPVEDVFPELPRLHVNEGGEKPLENGNLLPRTAFREVPDDTAPGAKVLVFKDNCFRAIYVFDAEKDAFRAFRMFPE